MRLCFVVQRYGASIAGGAEYHCRLVAERLARQARVEVITTCASDYLTWANREPEGLSELNGVAVRRFAVERPRDAVRFAELTARVFGEPARTEPGRVDVERARRAPLADAERWLEEQGPFSPGLVRHLDGEPPRARRLHLLLVPLLPDLPGSAGGGRAGPARAHRRGRRGLSPAPLPAPLPGPAGDRLQQRRGARNAGRAVGPGLAGGDVVGVGSELPARVDAAGVSSPARDRRPVPALRRPDRSRTRAARSSSSFFLRYRRETGSRLQPRPASARASCPSRPTRASCPWASGLTRRSGTRSRLRSRSSCPRASRACRW